MRDREGGGGMGCRGMEEGVKRCGRMGERGA